MTKRLISFLAAASMVFSLAACAQDAAQPAATTETGGTPAADASAGPNTEANAGGGEASEPSASGSIYPIVEEPITITWFYELDGKSSVSMTSYSEMKAFQKVTELTNINIDFQHPPTGQVAEQFNLMMASGDLTDVITYNWRTGYQGGATKALAEGLILPLNDLWEEHAPNIMAYYNAHPDHAKDAKTDDGVFHAYNDGSIEMFKYTSGEPKPAFKTGGWMIRKDWLDKLGLEMPETMDDWYNVLTAFKTQDPNGDGQEVFPMLHNGTPNNVHWWLRAWGYAYDMFSVVDGTVKFGPYEPEYRDYLTTMNKWYSEGLIDPDYVTLDQNQMDAKITNGQAGAWTGAISGTLGRLIQMMDGRGIECELVGTPFPSVDGGTAYNFDAASFYPVEALAHAISAKTEYPVEIVKLLDYGYGEEGNTLYNWGIEGESYTVDAEGNFQLTEEITANPDGLSLDQALMRYAPGGNNGPMFKSSTLWNQRMWMPEQQVTVANWSNGSGDRILPPTSFTTDESSKIADIMSRINTYRDEMLNKFIMGVVPLSEYDAYIANIESMGIQEAIAINQAAYERYLNR